MTFYQELQLNQAGSKMLIKNAAGGKEKARHIAIYLLKILITLVFCVAFVSIYSAIFGNENSIVGVVVLLCLMAFRFADFGVHIKDGMAILTLIIGIFMAGPRLANAGNAFTGLLVNGICIFLLMFFGCHHVLMSNQSTLVLGYLLLYGYDVTGNAYRMRLVGFLAGGILIGIVYYRNHRKKEYKRGIKSLFQEFHFHSLRTRWQISLTLGTASAMFLAECLGLPRSMWIGIAVMSVMTPFRQDVEQKVKGRIPGNLAGAILFLILLFLLPETVLPYLGIIGGIGVGLSATYSWQAVFNSLGAMAVAVGFLGVPWAIFFRVFHNLFGAFYGQIFHKVFYRLVDADI